jgi:hypothetical protein
MADSMTTPPHPPLPPCKKMCEKTVFNTIHPPYCTNIFNFSLSIGYYEELFTKGDAIKEKGV